MNPEFFFWLAVVLVGVGELAIKILTIAGLVKTVAVDDDRRVATIAATANILAWLGSGIFIFLLMLRGDFVSGIISRIIR